PRTTRVRKLPQAVPHLRHWIPVISDATYFSDPSLAPARRLQRAGDWDGAARLAPDTGSGAVLRAEILVDRHSWRLDPPHEVMAAENPRTARYLTALLQYWRRLLKCDREPHGPDPVDEFADLEAETRLATGSTAFFHGVALENLRRDTEAAQAAYRRALTAAL